MDRGTVKTSAIFVATRDRTEVYWTLAEIPAALRGKLDKLTADANATTLLIADRRGAQELLRSRRIRQTGELPAGRFAPRRLLRATWDLLQLVRRRLRRKPPASR
jgi:hypothetical protein